MRGPRLSRVLDVEPGTARTASSVAADYAASLLAPISPFERTLPRRLTDAELLAFAGASRHGLYRAIAAGEIQVERGTAKRRCNGRAGAAAIFVTLQAIAEWRSRRVF